MKGCDENFIDHAQNLLAVYQIGTFDFLSLR